MAKKKLFQLFVKNFRVRAVLLQLKCKLNAVEVVKRLQIQILQDTVIRQVPLLAFKSEPMQKLLDVGAFKIKRNINILNYNYKNVQGTLFTPIWVHLRSTILEVICSYLLVIYLHVRFLIWILSILDEENYTIITSIAIKSRDITWNVCINVCPFCIVKRHSLFKLLFTTSSSVLGIG